ncbi:MAG TPA: hypothetical protein VID27_14405 [Blastocatellia bacterium]|jgi:hypothetical protein
MKLEEITPGTLKRISQYRYDRIIEKHEGPWTWDYLIEDHLVEFINVNGYDVLLPVDKEHHQNISILRCIVSDDKQSLTIFLKDTTYETGIFAGYVAVCDKEPGEEWYIAILYHEWMIIDNRSSDIAT